MKYKTLKLEIVGTIYQLKNMLAECVKYVEKCETSRSNDPKWELSSNGSDGSSTHLTIADQYYVDPTKQPYGLDLGCNESNIK